MARRLGGASNLWGGRCLPIDLIDFRDRPWLGARGLADRREDLAPQAGGGLRGARRRRGGAGPRRCRGRGRRRLRLREPRALEQRAADRAAAPRRARGAARGLLVALGATATRLRGRGRPGGGGRAAPGRAGAGQGGGRPGGARRRRQREHAAAAGAAAPAARAFGAQGGPLGRFYMGHVNGQIADLALESQALDAGLDFLEDGHGSYVRRRLVPSEATQERGAAEQRRLLAGGAADRRPRAPLGAALGGVPGAVGRAGRAAAGRRADPAEACRRSPVPARRAPPQPRPRPRPDVGFAPWFLWKNQEGEPRLPGLFLRNPARRYGLSTTPSSCRTPTAG